MTLRSKAVLLRDPITNAKDQERPNTVKVSLCPHSQQCFIQESSPPTLGPLTLEQNQLNGKNYKSENKENYAEALKR